MQIIILFLFSFMFPSVNPWGIPQALLLLFITSIALVSDGARARLFRLKVWRDSSLFNLF